MINFGNRDVFVVSDLHFNQFLMIFFGRRPFSSKREMNEHLISSWNSTVKEDDYVFITGDLIFGKTSSFKDILTKLNGKIVLIKGNHDSKKRIEEIQRVLRISVFDKLSINLCGVKILFSHKPQSKDITEFDLNIHGHHHRKLRGKSLLEDKYFNASVEHIDYKPISIIEALKKKNINTSDFDLSSVFPMLDNIFKPNLETIQSV